MARREPYDGAWPRAQRRLDPGSVLRSRFVAHPSTLAVPAPERQLKTSDAARRTGVSTDSTSGLACSVIARRSRRHAATIAAATDRGRERGSRHRDSTRMTRRAPAHQRVRRFASPGFPRVARPRMRRNSGRSSRWSRSPELQTLADVDDRRARGRFDAWVASTRRSSPSAAVDRRCSRMATCAASSMPRRSRYAECPARASPASPAAVVARRTRIAGSPLPRCQTIRSCSMHPDAAARAQCPRTGGAIRQGGRAGGSRGRPTPRRTRALGPTTTRARRVRAAVIMVGRALDIGGHARQQRARRAPRLVDRRRPARCDRKLAM